MGIVGHSTVGTLISQQVQGLPWLKKLVNGALDETLGWVGKIWAGAQGGGEPFGLSFPMYWHDVSSKWAREDFQKYSEAS